MESESDNPEKGKLLKKSAHHRELLEEEIKVISEQTEKMLTNALVIGGALALTYFLVSRFTGGSKKSKSKSKSKAAQQKVAVAQDEDDMEDSDASGGTGIVSQIGSAVMAHATAFLLTIAKEKLAEFLQSQNIRKGNNDEHS